MSAASFAAKARANEPVVGYWVVQRIAEGFTFVTVASDLTHLEIAAANHLSTARGE
ncbi:hypothetical protein ACX80V_05705 [Arthrobacter sp. MDT3-24]